MRSIVFAIVLSACGYDLSVEHCAVVCASDDRACPEGLTCGPEGLCRADMASECVLVSDALGGVITHVAGRTIHTFDVSWSGVTFTSPDGLGSVDLLVVAGGGGGGSTRGGGGGGAGGVVHETNHTLTQASYVITIGYGGPTATSGGDSSFGPIVAIGGGAGRPSSTLNGGSGGGADHEGTGGTGTIGQGNRGGAAGFTNGGLTVFTGGGGGGAGATGAVGAPDAGGAGGPGLAVMISGMLVYYAGGGGGGAQDLAGAGLRPGAGGNGGGGNGGMNAIGTDGVDGTGGGGGGGGGRVTEVGEPPFYAGGRGGNGVVIISYPTLRQGS